jgi:hypothetical protein
MKKDMAAGQKLSHPLLFLGITLLGCISVGKYSVDFALVEIFIAYMSIRYFV